MRLISLMVAIVLPKAVKRGTDVDLTPVTENACRQLLPAQFRDIFQGTGFHKVYGSSGHNS